MHFLHTRVRSASVHQLISVRQIRFATVSRGFRVMRQTRGHAKYVWTCTRKATASRLCHVSIPTTAAASTIGYGMRSILILVNSDALPPPIAVPRPVLVLTIFLRGHRRSGICPICRIDISNPEAPNTPTGVATGVMVR